MPEQLEELKREVELLRSKISTLKNAAARLDREAKVLKKKAGDDCPGVLDKSQNPLQIDFAAQRTSKSENSSSQHNQRARLRSRSGRHAIQCEGEAGAGRRAAAKEALVP